METVKQGVDQKLVEGQEKLSQMWLTWNQKKQLQGVEGDLPKQEVTHCGVGHVGLGALTSLSTPVLRGPTCLECTPPHLASLCLLSGLSSLVFYSWVWGLLLNLGHLIVMCLNLLSHVLKLL